MDERYKEALRAEFKSRIEAHYAERKRQLDRDLQKDLAEVESLWSDPVETNGHRRVAPPAIPVSASATEGAEEIKPHTPSVAKGLPDNLTRRQAVTVIASEFGGDRYTVEDIWERYIVKFPEAVMPDLRHDIARQLRREVKDGRTKVVHRAMGPSDYNVYQQVDQGEGRLLDP